MVISVGDVVSRNLVDYGFAPNVLIVDNVVMREPIQPITADADQTLHTVNPAGTITDEAWNTVKQAIELAGQTKVVVDGEEDLLTVPVVLSAPEGSLVVYGQPRVGLVCIKVTAETKAKMRLLVEEMEESSKS